MLLLHMIYPSSLGGVYQPGEKKEKQQSKKNRDNDADYKTDSNSFYLWFLMVI